MEITAIFDDVDTAEGALVNMQALGIFPQSYKIRGLRAAERNGSVQNAAVYPGAARMSGAGLGSEPSTHPLSGGVITNIGAGGIFSAEITALEGAEVPGREVMLHITVSDTDSQRARSALISNHARRVREVQ